jgi:hypothetical protein
MMNLLIDLFRKQPLLTATAWIHAGLALLMLVGLVVDHRSILGLNPWVKPLKFAVSIALYLFSIALFLSYFPGQTGMLFWATLVIAVTMLVEISLISLQAIRGTTSHFNVSTPFDAGVLYTMGIAIVVNTLMIGIILWLFFDQPPALAPSYLWGIRLGLIIFIIGSVQGFMMISRMAHTVGAPDGGPGLPIANWSTQYGDLRVAHFVGLHGLQIVPLVGYLSGGGSSLDKDTTSSLVWVFGVAGIMTGVMIWTLAQALSGKPLIDSK